jgi:hypothetical protein
MREPPTASPGCTHEPDAPSIAKSIGVRVVQSVTSPWVGFVSTTQFASRAGSRNVVQTTTMYVEVMGLEPTTSTLRTALVVVL